MRLCQTAKSVPRGRESLLTTTAPKRPITMLPPEDSGLRWEQTLFDLVPRWTREPLIPAIETVCRQELSIGQNESCKVVFHASGLFNKLYIVDRISGPRLIIRVSLPVYPRHKARAEVATLRWVRENTDIPVPAVLALDDSNDNDIGFEWILMEFMDGISAHDRWWTMSMEQKVLFTEQIAKFQAELSGSGKTEPGFRGIGTLDLDYTGRPNDPSAVVPGILVSPQFFVGDHLQYEVPRGPFLSSHDWLTTELDIILRHQNAVLESSEDEDEIEDAENVLSAVQKLLPLVPRIFPSSLQTPEMTALYHHDLHLNNILVDDQGNITAVLDWECVSTMPRWMSARIPNFLEGPNREEEPNRDEYLGAQAETKQSEFQEKNELYYIHQMEYEATQLRKVYMARLRKLWLECPLETSHDEVDLFQAIQQCDGIWAKRVWQWADRVHNGETIRFGMVGN